MRSVSPNELEVVLGLPSGSLTVTSDFERDYLFDPPLAQEQQATAIKLLKEGVADDWVAAPLPDWTGFATWRYQNIEYIALVNGPYSGSVGLFEGAIARGDYGPAIAILAGVASAVPTQLAADLESAARRFHLPEELINALMSTLKGSNELGNSA